MGEVERGSGYEQAAPRPAVPVPHEFPQLFQYMDEYVQRIVNFDGANPCELGLEKYVKRMVERLRDGIVPDESEGEPPLMPILNRYEPVGGTTDGTSRRGARATRPAKGTSVRW